MHAPLGCTLVLLRAWLVCHVVRCIVRLSVEVSHVIVVIVVETVVFVANNKPQ